jgi:ABC-type cobalamin transport system ATPase subunit
MAHYYSYTLPARSEAEGNLYCEVLAMLDQVKRAYPQLSGDDWGRVLLMGLCVYHKLNVVDDEQALLQYVVNNIRGLYRYVVPEVENEPVTRQ